MPLTVFTKYFNHHSPIPAAYAGHRYLNG